MVFCILHTTKLPTNPLKQICLIPETLEYFKISILLKLLTFLIGGHVEGLAKYEMPLAFYEV